MKKHFGFTLIELLVVIAIIAILSTIVLASLQSAKKKAQDARIRSSITQMKNQAEIYYDIHGSYGPGNDPYSCGRAFSLASSSNPNSITLFMQGIPGIPNENNLYLLVKALAEDANRNNGQLIPDYTQNANLLCRVGIQGRIVPPQIPRSDVWAVAAKFPGSQRVICADSTGTVMETVPPAGQTLELWVLPRGDYTCPTN